MHLRAGSGAVQQRQAGFSQHSGSVSKPVARCSRLQSRSERVVCQSVGNEEQVGKTIMVKNTPGDMPFPWSEKDPYKLPVSIDRVQKLLATLGWEKPWVEQITDRLMKNMLRTTEERAQSVIDYLLSIGLRQDEICNMACISVVLLGLNPETRMKSTVEYLKKRGVPDASIPDLVLKHPRIFEYKVEEGSDYVVKGLARIQVDVLPALPPKTEMVCSVNYFREGASFMVAPVSPAGPVTIAIASA